MVNNYCFFADVAQEALIHVKRFCDFINADCAKFENLSDAREVLGSLMTCFEKMHDLFEVELTSSSDYAIYHEGLWQASIGII